MIKDFNAAAEFAASNTGKDKAKPSSKDNGKKSNGNSQVAKFSIFQPNIAVIGIGGAGTNAVNNLMSQSISNVNFYIANTDVKSLGNSLCPNKIHLGVNLTKGLGAGSDPEIGLQAAEQSKSEITEALQGVDLLFIIAGMGGGTGTGATPLIAQIAKEMGILTLGFVTTPFSFEGAQRNNVAVHGISELEKHIDALTVMPNQNLFKVVSKETGLMDAFSITDKVIYSAIKAISDLIVANGMINLDFNDIKHIIHNGGKSLVSSLEVQGGDKISKITQQILNNPLVDDGISIMNARNILISITGGKRTSLHEIDQIINSIRNQSSNTTYVNFGVVIDENMGESIRISVIATGIESGSNAQGNSSNVHLEQPDYEQPNSESDYKEQDFNPYITHKEEQRIGTNNIRSNNNPVFIQSQGSEPYSGGSELSSHNSDHPNTYKSSHLSEEPNPAYRVVENYGYNNQASPSGLAVNIGKDSDVGSYVEDDYYDHHKREAVKHSHLNNIKVEDSLMDFTTSTVKSKPEAKGGGRSLFALMKDIDNKEAPNDDLFNTEQSFNQSDANEHHSAKPSKDINERLAKRISDSNKGRSHSAVTGEAESNFFNQNEKGTKRSFIEVPAFLKRKK